MVENYEIFKGKGSAEPGEIRDALGCLDSLDMTEEIPSVIGAVMTLCNRVAQLEAEVVELRSLVTPLGR